MRSGRDESAARWEYNCGDKGERHRHGNQHARKLSCLRRHRHVFRLHPTTTPACAAALASLSTPILYLFPRFRRLHLSRPDSYLVLAAQGGSCHGLQAIGGVSTYYADVITAAQSYLTQSGRANVQKAIVFLSDGDSNSQPPNVSSPQQTPHECQNGINAAQTAAAAGTWVYSVAYGASTAQAPGGSCATDSAPMSACRAMQQIASDPTKYYSDDQGSDPCISGANPMVDLNQIFGNIGIDLTNARLLPDNAT